MLRDDLTRDRLLWLAVVVQAVEDIRFEPYTSLEFDAAYAFFAHDGKWREARRAIADMIDRHPDEIKRAGLACLAERERIDPRPRPVPKPPRQKPAPAATPPSCVHARYYIPEFYLHG